AGWRTERWWWGGEGRQSTRRAGSPDRKRRYCQKFSPGPARLRPCSPWMTVAAMRRASRIRRGMVCASERASPLARCVALISCLSARCFTAAIPLSDARIELADAAFQALAGGARGKGQRHGGLEDRLRHGGDIVDRRREPPVDEGAGARHQHERLARAGAWAPGNQLADLAALRAGARRAHEVEDRLHHRFADRQAAPQAPVR